MNSTLKFQLDIDHLNHLLETHPSGYSQAHPFPNVVIDDFLPPSVLEAVLNEFPPAKSGNWKTFKNAAEKKLASPNELQMGDKKKILPIFNRCTIFSTTDFSYHGHPEPLTCTEGNTRKSLALYYYSNGRPAAEIAESHSTIFKSRPGEGVLAPSESKFSTKELIKPCIPPTLLHQLKKLNQKQG